MNSSIVSAFCVHDDHWFLKESVLSFKPAGPVYVFLSRKAWDGSTGEWKRARKAAKEAGADVVEGEWLSEAEHRAAALDHLRRLGYSHAFIPDGDEIIEPALLQALERIADADLADRVFVHWDTYWKSVEYVIRPRERFTPLILLRLDKVHHLYGRLFGGGRPLLLQPEHGLIHHLSYAGPDERIERKTKTWGHRDEVVPGWNERVWKAWDDAPFVRALHPTHPEAYDHAERMEVPEILKPLAPSAARQEIGRPKSWPKISIVIPVHGQKEALTSCLQSLQRCSDIWHEVILVDNASPDGAWEAASGLPRTRVIHSKQNEGFAKASNMGAAAAKGAVLLFLNSDTIVPRAGLIRLIEGLLASAAIGAAGPYTNNSGHFQQIQPCYSEIGQIDLFAEDFALHGGRDRDVDMLVGFCLAIMKSTFEEAGCFDESFGLGTFEDNDLCYRLRRAGYRLLLCGKSYVHHEGSLTLRAVAPEIEALLIENREKFLAKWCDDLYSGYASGLSGLSPEPIQFRPDLKPETRMQARPRISLCMIVKNEERVLKDCLISAKPFFDEMIVVDTGSTDRTKEIAERMCAKVFDFPWTDSFSEARNESLRHAGGDWIFWMDADDTLPVEAGRAIRRSAETAPPEIHGFVVPVQFVEEGPGAGTRVDHIKLFRNLSGLKFTFRIHEQIAGSLREHKGEIARLEAVVLHSGYDTSPEGQARKTERDWKLLRLDYKEQGDHPFVLFNIGMTRHYSGRHADAINWLKRSIRFSHPGDSHVRKAHALIARSLRELGRFDDALAAVEAGLGMAPGDPELNFEGGMTHWRLGRLAEAERQFLACPKGDISGLFSSVDMGILGFKAYANAAETALAQGDSRRAVSYLKEALKGSPGMLSLAFDAFNIAVEARDRAGAQDMLEYVRGLEGPSENWARMLQKYVLLIHGEASVEPELERAMLGFPDAIGPRLVYARNLLTQEKHDKALPHLHWLDSRGVAEGAYCLGIFAIRDGRYSEALAHMLRANELNPGHEDTLSQINALQKWHHS